MNIIQTVLQLAGSLAFLLYGMKMMSDGVQKSAGDSLQHILGFMTGNRLMAVITGILVTMIIQSSGATTVMVVSFVNSGLLTLTQSIGVIFGANIGTTVTAWIVALFGFNFKISLFAVPVFGLGYLLTLLKKLHKESIGEFLMGFGMLFLGLDMLSSVVSVEPEKILFLTQLQGMGFASTMIGVFAGFLLTVLLHSSSASTAIILTMAYNRILEWEFSAAMILGSNIGSTVDSVLAAVNTKVNARRAASIHVMFNVIGTVIAVIMLKPLLHLVDFLVPGNVYSGITYHIAMLHTIFNLLATVIFLPFTKQIAHLTERLIKPRENEKQAVYKLEFIDAIGRKNTLAHIVRAEKAIADMADLVIEMFDHLQLGFSDRSQNFIDKHMESLVRDEDYADQMSEQITHYLLKCGKLPVGPSQQNNISLMMSIVDELENMTDDCYNVACLLKKSIEKKMVFLQENMDKLIPYVELVRQFITFIHININKRLSAEKLEFAKELEEQIDATRKNLKKTARKRLESGADVKSELLYIDVVRQIEKIGDCAFNIAGALSETR
ncbi:Na/Pi cotransporter family protein [Treponema parvum]|uniref:Na/Pi cotransporter family protein n=1 Tax=Treponema parvum TaxID=138851 RepID=A0A975F2W7_9SPIR|nr:Na/Pi cotransporter family protein [Treponema parvum]QTQ13386.1 Na/Pi cotransporter family protein [Treponema parvum]